APSSCYALSLHDALPIWNGRAVDVDERTGGARTLMVERARHESLAGSRLTEEQDRRRDTLGRLQGGDARHVGAQRANRRGFADRSEEHTSELQSRVDLVC